MRRVGAAHIRGEIADRRPFHGRRPGALGVGGGRYSMRMSRFHRGGVVAAAIPVRTRLLNTWVIAYLAE